MIQVEIDKLNPEDFHALAKLTVDARKDTVLESTISIEERIESIKALSENKAFRILVAKDDDGRIVGWTYYYTAFPLMTFISGFYPVVDQTDDADRIAMSLIDAGKNEILEREHTRLEIEIELPTDAHRTMSEIFVNWYKKSGFRLAAEEVHMTTDLTSIELPDLEIPEGYILRTFSDVSTDLLIESGYEIFSNSMEDLFRSMSQEEKKVNLDYWFNKSRPFHEDASLVLLRDDKIVGFVIAKPMDEEIEIGPIGLIHDVRGQGLGTILLGTSLKVLIDENVKIAALDTSRNNSLSRKLYTKFGFKDVFYKLFYYWSP